MFIYEKIIRNYSNNKKEIICPILDKDEFCIYILECADGSFYVGFSNNLSERLASHSSGAGAEYTKKRLPLKLIYCEIFKERIFALKRERQLKGWSRKKKEKLII